jgi:hypothetical protein
MKTSVKESLGLYELKQHKPRFDKECSQFLDQRKQAKMYWAQDQNKSHVDNVNHVRCEASRYLGGKKNI